MKLRHVAVLALVLLVGAGGAYFYAVNNLETQVRAGLEAFKADVAPEMTVQYGTVSVDLFGGTATVSPITATTAAPSGRTVDISIARARAFGFEPFQSVTPDDALRNLDLFDLVIGDGSNEHRVASLRLERSNLLSVLHARLPDFRIFAGDAQAAFKLAHDVVTEIDLKRLALDGYTASGGGSDAEMAAFTVDNMHDGAIGGFEISKFSAGGDKGRFTIDRFSIAETNLPALFLEFGAGIDSRDIEAVQYEMARLQYRMRLGILELLGFSIQAATGDFELDRFAVTHFQGIAADEIALNGLSFTGLDGVGVVLKDVSFKTLSKIDGFPNRMMMRMNGFKVVPQPPQAALLKDILGVDVVTLDVRTDFEWDGKSAAMPVGPVTFDFHDLIEIDMTYIMGGMPSAAAFRDLMGKVVENDKGRDAYRAYVNGVTIKAVGLVLRDKSVVGKLVDFAAAQGDMDRAAFVKANRDALAPGMENMLGTDLADRIAGPVAAFLATGGTLSLQTKTKSDKGIGVQMAPFLALAPQSLIQLVDIEVTHTAP